MREKNQERWRKLAEQAAKEQDKLIELTKQINEILDENDSKHKPLEGSAA